MRKHSMVGLIGFFLLLHLLTATTLAQVLRARGAAPRTVPEAIQALRDAADHEKAAERVALVDAINAALPTQGPQILDPIIKAVQNRHGTDDPVFVVNCILTLGEVKARQASDTLVSVLSDTNMQYAYEAAVALGRIWQGAASAPEVTRVNAALLALAYSDLPPAVVYGPAVALININGLPVAEPTRMSSDELLAELDKWVMSGPSALPPVDQLPWQVLVRLVVAGDDTTRTAAVGALRQQRELGAVDPILKHLSTGASGPAAQQMAQILGELTGVPYPADAASGATPQERADNWRGQWLTVLKTKTDQKSVNYAWQAMERALRFYAVSPDEATAKRISEYRNTLLYQLQGPEAIPAGASPEARTLLSDALRVKAEMSEAIATLEKPPVEGDFERGQALNAMERLMNQPSGVTVARQFLSRLIAVTRAEPSGMFAARLGNTLWRISAVPLQLDGPTLEARQQQVDDWLDTVRRTRPQLGL